MDRSRRVRSGLHLRPPRVASRAGRLESDRQRNRARKPRRDIHLSVAADSQRVGGQSRAGLSARSARYGLGISAGAQRAQPVGLPDRLSLGAWSDVAVGHRCDSGLRRPAAFQGALEVVRKLGQGNVVETPPDARLVAGQLYQLSRARARRLLRLLPRAVRRPEFPLRRTGGTVPRGNRWPRLCRMVSVVEPWRAAHLGSICRFAPPVQRHGRVSPRTDVGRPAGVSQGNRALP